MKNAIGELKSQGLNASDPTLESIYELQEKVISVIKSFITI